ncbi:MAG: 2-amino-4-hydroxy-6-hydroxymethyldihydropteridine diphosphokinase [Bacteroidota bacterium]|nr:2-amino-4-hydroxy-6-hydroxymethyldihydropteridine diphosphokinase [Bacteroidota bacterium]
MSNLYLSIGGNLGDRAENLSDCRENIRLQIGEIVKSSSIYESESWGFSHPRDFYNQVLHVKTDLLAKKILDKIQNIETALGRTRKKSSTQAYESRIIDIDILLLDQFVIQENELIIPHPHMQNRNFVMIPLVEITDTLIHPIIKKSMKEILDDCPDKGRIKRVVTKKSISDEQR